MIQCDTVRQYQQIAGDAVGPLSGSTLFTRRLPVTTVSGDARPMLLEQPIEPGIALSAVRSRLITALHNLDEDHRYDVLLVVTELVSNVLDHTIGTGTLRLIRSTTRCEILVEVDDTTLLLPVHGRSRLGDTRGRGVVVVDNLTREWGTHPSPTGGKTVFAAVPCGGGNEASSCRWTAVGVS